MQLSVPAILRKALVIGLVGSLTLNSFTNTLSYAAVDTLKIEKAQSLGTLGFIKGTNGNYNLEGQLKRSEALVLIAALKGDQLKIEQAKSRVATLKFKDVKANEWYAPYVLYGIENQIASGTAKDKFSPNDPVTHRQFLKMLLSALSYESDKDYNWLGVDEFSKQTGILDKEASDSFFDQKLLRGDAFNYLYNALLQVNKNGSETQVERLINSNLLTQSALDATQLGKDFLNSPYGASARKDAATVPVSINTHASSHGKLEIKFSQAMNVASVQNTSNYKITLVNAPQVSIPILSAVYDAQNQTVVLKTSGDGSDTVFNVTASNLLTKERDHALVSENNRYTGSSSLKTIVPNGNRITIQMNGLSTKGVTAESLQLTPVDATASRPTISQVIDKNENQFTLITSGMRSGSIYQLRFTELYDSHQQLVNAEFFTYCVAGNTEPPKIVEVIGDYDGTSLIRFDKGMNDGTVTDLNNVSLVSEYGKTIKVQSIEKTNSNDYKINHGQLGANVRYFLELRHQKDQDGNDIGTLSKTLTGNKFSDLTVTSSQFVSPTELVFQISEPLDVSTVKTASNYYIYDREDRIYTPANIQYNAGSTEVRLVFAAPVSSGFKVIFVINNLRNANDFPVPQITIYADTVK